MVNIIHEQAALAVKTLKSGGIILYPTDTVWGIGCDATNEDAVRRIYELKRSADKKSMLVLVGSADQAARYVKRMPDIAWELMDVADEPLTLILPGAAGLAQGLIPEEGTLGMRVPDHDFCREMLRLLRKPVVSTSANISGEASPAGFGDIAVEIKQGVDMVVDPACEGHPTRRPSSIIMLGEGGQIKIIRE